MDPTANLAESLRIANRMLDPESESMDTGGAVRLAELVLALDEWIGGGGGLPQSWDADARSWKARAPF
jgi:hypothetical protein